LQASVVYASSDERQKKYLPKDDFWPESSYHGYVEINKKNDETFYWYFESRKNKVFDP